MNYSMKKSAILFPKFYSPEKNQNVANHSLCLRLLFFSSDFSSSNFPEVLTTPHWGSSKIITKGKHIAFIWRVGYQIMARRVWTFSKLGI